MRTSGLSKDSFFSIVIDSSINFKQSYLGKKYYTKYYGRKER